MADEPDDVVEDDEVDDDAVDDDEETTDLRIERVTKEMNAETSPTTTNPPISKGPGPQPDPVTDYRAP